MAQPETIAVALSTSPAYECGAVLLAYLAFPAPTEAKLRATAQAALCKVALVADITENPALEWTPMLVKPGYLLLAEGEANRVLRTFDTRLCHRLVAARMVMPFLQEADAGRPPPLPAGVERWSIQQVAALVLADTGNRETVNVESRVWAPSLPVIHLAAALAIEMAQAKAKGVPRIGPDVIMRVGEFLARWVETAHYLEALIEQSPKLARAAKQLVRFRLA